MFVEAGMGWLNSDYFSKIENLLVGYYIKRDENFGWPCTKFYLCAPKMYYLSFLMCVCKNSKYYCTFAKMQLRASGAVKMCKRRHGQMQLAIRMIRASQNDQRYIGSQSIVDVNNFTEIFSRDQVTNVDTWFAVFQRLSRFRKLCPNIAQMLWLLDGFLAASGNLISFDVDC